MNKLNTIIKNAKIYAIKSPNTTKVYVGSTELDLEHRLRLHKTNKKTTSHIVMDCGDPFIELLEEHKEITREELLKREGHYITTIKECINKNLPSGGSLYNRKIECGCGKSIRYYGRKQHKKTKFHLLYEKMSQMTI